MDLAVHQKINGINFLYLKGTSIERARIHARALRREIREGVPVALGKKNEWIIRRGIPMLSPLSPLQEIPLWFYKKVLIRMLDRWKNHEYQRVLRAMAEETGIPLETFRESLFHADALMLLARTSIMRHVLKDLPAGGLPGCSSGVALGQWTKSGKMLACRNMDYPLVGPWESNTTVFFHVPEEKDQLPHVAVATAGVHTAGLTAMNAEGITLCTHAHFGKNVSVSGIPVMEIGNEIVRSAHSINDAIDIARKHRRIGNWAFVITSAREDDAVIVEMTADKTLVRHPDDGFLAHTNFFHTKALQEHEALISGACCDDLVGRLCRMREILESHRGELEPTHMAEALGDHIDYLTGEERVFGNTISVTTTVKSVVFEPASLKLWVGDREQTPVGLGTFTEVDMKRFLDPKTWKQEPVKSLPKIQGKKVSEDLAEGIKHYRDAYRAWHMFYHEEDFAERALYSLRKAVKAYPKDGNLWVQAGIVASFLQQFEEGKEYFSEALKRVLAPHVKGVATLYLARCLDIHGDREQALKLYQQHGEIREPKLKAAFLKGLRTPFSPRDTKSMMLDLQFPDTHTY